MSPKIVIFFIAIAVCVSVLNAHPDERKRRQIGSSNDSGSGGKSTTAAPSGGGGGGSGGTTPSSSGGGGSGTASTASAGNGGSGGSGGGLFTYLAGTLQGIPFAGGILFTVFTGLGGVLGGLLPFLG